MFHNFGHPALTLQNINFCRWKTIMQKLWMYLLPVLKLVHLSKVKLFLSWHAHSIYKVRKPKMTKLRQGVKVKAHYTSWCIFVHDIWWTVPVMTFALGAVFVTFGPNKPCAFLCENQKNCFYDVGLGVL